MTEDGRDSHQDLLLSLRERAKELDCMYRVEEKLSDDDMSLPNVMRAVVGEIASGMQYPDTTAALITYAGETYKSREFEPTMWGVCTDIKVQDRTVGSFCIYYLDEMPGADEGPFLKEEMRLLRTLADRLSHYILYRRLKDMRQSLESAQARDNVGAWRGAIRLLRASDRALYLKITRKMLNHLYGLGVEDARGLLQEAEVWSEPDEMQGEVNVPGRRRSADTKVLLTDRPFEVAAMHLSGEAILDLVQKWLQEDKASFFVKVLANPRSSLPEISEAIRRYRSICADDSLSEDVMRGFSVSLSRRFLTEQIEFIKIAKDYLDIDDFGGLLDQMILPADSHGRMGGKSAGLLLANAILQKVEDPKRPVGDLRVPKTWFLSSDAILDFISQNDLNDVIEQKFKEISQVRHEYPNVIQLFKDSIFPAEIIKGVAVALDDLEDVPLIIRSSSLLEDRLGTAFSGKYKSLFLANQGSKKERIGAMLDAIAEVYASVFGPDPIEYRRDRGLLEFNEEMGIIIQEVVGKQVGKYFFPAFSGVAFSNNEFRWSPRIKREDGIVRLVPGLGTRAVDRVSDDYAALVVPGQPNLRVNVALDEIIRYSPKKLDVINLETRTFETIEAEQLLRELGTKMPGFTQVYSIVKGDTLQKPVPLLTDPENDEFAATFEPLFSGTDFVSRMGNILKILEERMGTPVDVEFAHDGEHLYLLQCRPQSFTAEDAPAPIPKDVDVDRVVFSAERFVSNGWLPDITHLVYVDAMKYAALPDRKAMLDVGRAVGRLNKMLPKRQFILMGPGRWGSRGDVKLGVSITYADISNTAMLVEIARKKGDYVPDLSFGTHFFQDLVESRIRYLPLYPDEPEILFNERFLSRSENLLPRMLPEFESLSDVLRVIDVPASSGGDKLRVLMNAELNEALAYLVSQDEPDLGTAAPKVKAHHASKVHWRWRLNMAENIASQIDTERFGVVAFYVFGSTKNATAGPASDIDLLIHFRGSSDQRCELQNWLEGWSLCLAEMNFLRTGYRSDGLLDLHFITDEDIEKRDSFAIKIGAVTDPARELPMGSS
jgi:pyruvate, water dikinase